MKKLEFYTGTDGLIVEQDFKIGEDTGLSAYFPDPNGTATVSTAKVRGNRGNNFVRMTPGVGWPGGPEGEMATVMVGMRFIPNHMVIEDEFGDQSSDEYLIAYPKRPQDIGTRYQLLQWNLYADITPDGSQKRFVDKLYFKKKGFDEPPEEVNWTWVIPTGPIDPGT